MPDTGVSVSTGDVITAAKCNLKLETTADRAALGIIDSSGAGSFAMNIVVVSTYLADRILSITTGDAARGITLAGDLVLGGTLTTAAVFTTSGAFALTLTVGNTTNATIPSGTVTLMDLGTAQTVTGAKRFADDAILIENPAANFYYTITGAAIGANRVLTLPLLLAGDTVAVLDFAQTFTNKTLTAPTINGGIATALTGLGIRSTGTGAFDLTLANTENLTAGRTLTLTLNNVARTISLGGNLTLGAAFTTTPANAVTFTTTGGTALTLPTAGTLAILGANTFTAAQTFTGSVITVLNIATSPIVDIGASVFETGTFIDIAYDVAETLTGALIGINVDLSTNVTISNQSVTGLDVTLPGTFGNGTEYGIRVRGDGQTILIGNDADLFLSLAKASSVDILFQGITPVIDIGADVLAAGTIIDFQYDTAQILAGGALVGISMNLNTNITPVGGQNVTAYTAQTPAFTNAAAAATVITGFQLPTAGALVSNNAGAALTWYGIDLQMPNITQTSGAMIAMGIRLTEGTTTSGTINAININGVGVDTIINFSASPIVDIGADVFSLGTAIDFAFDTAETATGALIGVSINMNTNLTPLGGQDITGYTTQTAAFSSVAAAATVITGYQLTTAGALVMNNAGGSITWYGLNVTLPDITQTAGAMVAIGIQLTEGTTTSGTANAININGAVDTILNFSASPVLDIGADVFSTGYFADIGFDTIETLTAQLTGIRIDWDTVIVTTGAAGTGNITAYWADMGQMVVNAAYNATIYGIRLDLDFTVGGAETIYGASIVLPAVFGAGTEVGVHITGDGQTINIGNDADLYVSFAKAGSVDINIQGVSPMIDVGADVLVAGYFVSLDYDTAETTTGDLYLVDALRAANALTLGADLYGVNLNLATNVVNVTDRDVTGYRVTLGALTQSAANTTTLIGFNLAAAGALVQDTNAGVLAWRGVNIQLPNTTQTTGTVTAYGVNIEEGATTSGTVAAIRSNVTLSLLAAKATTIRMAAATAAALDVDDGTTDMLRFDSRVTTSGVSMLTITSAPATFAAAAGSFYSVVRIPAYTLTLTGVTGITALDGLGLYIGAPTVTNGDANTTGLASTLYVAAPAAAGTATLTLRYIINTGTAGCFLTAAGVWTDASTRTTKRDILYLGVDVPWEDVLEDIQRTKAATFRRDDPSDGGYMRYGAIAEEVPDYLAMPGRQGIGSIYMAGAAFAGVQALIHENTALKAQMQAMSDRLSKAGIK